MRFRDVEESVHQLGADGAVGGLAGPRIAQHGHSAGPGRQPKVKMHADSSQVESILKPVRGIRDAQARAGITPTDHFKHNVQSIKEKSRLNALQKLQQQHEAATAPRVQRQSGAKGEAGLPRRVGPGAAGTGLGGGSVAAARADGGGSRHASGSGAGRNFLEENKVAAAAAAGVRAAGEAQGGRDSYLGRGDYGRVPQYLLERKLQLAAEYEAQQAAKMAAMVPPGMRLLPDEERRETLAILDRNWAEVERQLQALPIIIETPSQVRRKEDLERRLYEIEDARKVFNRPNVLVRV